MSGKEFVFYFVYKQEDKNNDNPLIRIASKKEKEKIFLTDFTVMYFC